MLTVYKNEHDVFENILALVRGGSKEADSPQRAYKILSVETIWSCFEEARRSNVHIGNVLLIRKQDSEVGSNEACGQHWLRKLHALYDQRKVGSIDDASHLCIAADASVHSVGFDILVGLAYSWESSAAAFCDFQYLTPGKKLPAAEVELLDYVAELAREK